MNFYSASIGSKELRFFGESDSRAIRKVSRWFSMFWIKYETEIKCKYPASIAVEMNKVPKIELWKISVGTKEDNPFQVIPNLPYTRII